MSLIERWTPPSAKALADALASGDLDATRKARLQCALEENDHLRQQLRGAVEDRDDLAGALERRDVEYVALRDDRDRLQALLGAHKGFLRDALNRLGGQ